MRLNASIEALGMKFQTSIKEISRRVNVWSLNMPLLAKQAVAVIGQNHAAESVTGFYTKFGDGAADIIPLWRLNKRQGRYKMLQSTRCP